MVLQEVGGFSPASKLDLTSDLAAEDDQKS